MSPTNTAHFQCHGIDELEGLATGALVKNLIGETTQTSSGTDRLLEVTETASCANQEIPLDEKSAPYLRCDIDADAQGVGSGQGEAAIFGARSRPCCGYEAKHSEADGGSKICSKQELVYESKQGIHDQGLASVAPVAEDLECKKADSETGSMSHGSKPACDDDVIFKLSANTSNASQNGTTGEGGSNGPGVGLQVVLQGNRPTPKGSH